MHKVFLAALSGLTLVGCVSVENAKGIVPPSGVVSDFSAPIVMPRESFSTENLKVGKSSGSVYVKEWVFSGISADVCDMTLKEAMEEGGITHLMFADYHQYSFFGFVTVFTVTAYGI